MRLQVPSLALLSGLRIWRCCELWCRLQMRLRSCVDSTPSLGTAIAAGAAALEKAKRPKKKKKKNLATDTSLMVALENRNLEHGTHTSVYL